MKKANAYAKQLLAEHPTPPTPTSLPASPITLSAHRAAAPVSRSGLAEFTATKNSAWSKLQDRENGRYLRPFAKIILALAARREKQDALAQKLFRELTEQYRKTNNSRPNTPKPWTRRYSQTNTVNPPSPTLRPKECVISCLSSLPNVI